MAVTEKQVGVYMSQREHGRIQTAAAAKAGIGERTGRRIEQGQSGLPRHRRMWRTRKDPFALVWESELVPLLKCSPKLQALTLLEELQRRYPGKYPNSRLRTLQRRVKVWRAHSGPDKEVMFRQVKVPGQLGLSDFTILKDVAITLAGEPFEHRLYHFRLAYSGWSFMSVVLGGESFSALAEGLANALARLGGAPAEHRTESLSAAFKNLSDDEREDLTARYAALCAHYRMAASRNNLGEGHENGAIESPHGHLKRRIEQSLLLRGSSDFPSLPAYREWLDAVVADHNRRHATALEDERPYLQALPATAAATYTEYCVRVTTSSTISVRLVVYSVPSRLIGERLKVHLYDDRLVGLLGTTEVLTLPRVYPPAGKRRARRIDYRHLAESLARKPMAFYHAQFRDDLLPNAAYRDIWRQLEARTSRREACRLMVGCLYLAARCNCEQALAQAVLDTLARGELPDLLALNRQFGEAPPPAPMTSGHQHALDDYDALLTCGVAQGGEVAHA